MNNSGDADRIVAGIDEAAVEYPLLQAQIAVERQRRSLQVELGLERQVQLIDVAGTDLVLNFLEPFQIGVAVPRVGQSTQYRVADGLRGQPRLNLRTGHGPRLAVEPEPEQRNLAHLRHQVGKLGFQHVAQFIGEKAGGMQPPADARREGIECSLDLAYVIGADDLLRVLKQQRHGSGAGGIVEQNESFSQRRRLRALRRGKRCF